MKALFLSVTTASLFAIGCGPLPAATKVTIADMPSPLTTAGDDVLFTLTLSESDAPISVADLDVYAGLPGQTATVVNFTHNDTNNDGKLDVGETLTTREPGVNLFDATQVGKTFNVGFAQKNASGVFVTLATASWTPAQ